MSRDAWFPEETPAWDGAAGEAVADGEAVLSRWMGRLQSEFPQRISHLVWDADRIRLLEEALDVVVRDDADCPSHLLPFFRRSVINRITGLGPLDPLLLDDTVTEIMVNGQHVYVERHGVIEPCPVEFYHGQEVEDLARRIANRAGRELNTETPLCDARLSDGSRIHCVLPPVSEVPTITIRRAPMNLMGIDDWFHLGSISTDLWEDLAFMVRSRKNIIIAGGASSGKTSLLRLLVGCAAQDERLVTIEDVRELNVPHPNTVRLEAFGHFTVRDLVANALRMRPDRIIVGEVRGPEALDLIDAMSSGHPGSLCTVHCADGGMRAVHRLARMALQRAQGLSFESLTAQIMDTIDVIVYLVREPGGNRRVDTVMDVRAQALHLRWHWDGGELQRDGVG